MDVSKLNLPDPKNPRVNSAPIADLDYYKFKVGCKLKRKSLATGGQTALYTYVLRNWPEDEQRLIVEANKRGMTPEELFTKLATEDGDE
jgi:hypothetical protein